MRDVRAMCAIGRRGQLGLHGRLPWEGDPAPEYAADVARFWQQTHGHVLVAGPTTFASIPAVVFVGGGPPVWAAFADLIRIWDITRLPYDGAADRWFDPAWLVRRPA